MKVVVLDAHTLSPLAPGEMSPDHPSWHRLGALGDLQLYERTPPIDVLERIGEAEIVLTNKVLLSRDILLKAPFLRYVGVMATGVNNVDLSAARERGIVVTNVPRYSAPSVVQTVFALLFELVGRSGETAQAVRQGAWVRCPDFSFTLGPWRELHGKTFGVIGFGEIGSAVARVALALGMRVLAFSRSRRVEFAEVEWEAFEKVLERADVVSLHCPLTSGTTGMINALTLARMKPGAYLINTGRGPLVVETDVAAALHAGRLGGFAADVLCKEPPDATNPLIGAPRSVITPHLAWSSIEARQRLMDTLVTNIEAFLSGKPINVVTP